MRAIVNRLIPLKLLSPGKTAEIGQLLGDRQHVHRLEELGLRVGTEIEMIQCGDPCIIRLSGTKLCFRENETLNVFVRDGEVA